MSSTTPATAEAGAKGNVPPPSHFAKRADEQDPTWLEDAITAYLGLRLGPKQREICRSVVETPMTAVVGANGTGKTYITAAIVLAWQTVRYPAISFGTSGTGKKLYRTLCRPIEKLHRDALGGQLPGTYKMNPPRIDYADPEHYFEAATPQDAGELEGAHSAYTLAIIEEADKDDVTPETVDAMRSLIPTYETSRMLAVGNPPKTEANVFSEMIDATRSPWNVVRVSSFGSFNVQAELGNVDGPLIDGMATVSALKKDWQGYHDIPWPGVEQAMAWTDPDSPQFREDLDERWYRRRGGLMPPGGAQVHRPLTPQLVEEQYQPEAEPDKPWPPHLGVDVARSGDDTVAMALYDAVLETAYAEQGTDHTVQEQELADRIRGWRTPQIAVDAIGEGSGLADGLAERYGRTSVYRYKTDAVAAAETEYDRCWGESLALFNDYLAAGGVYTSHDLYKQAMAAARTITWEERHLGSRGEEDGEDVLRATSKEEVRDRLDRSPDHLDAALMAIWRRDADHEETQDADSGFSFEL